MWSDPSKQRGDYQGWVCWQRVTREGPTHQFPSHYRCHLRRRGVFSWRKKGCQVVKLIFTLSLEARWHIRWQQNWDRGKKCNELIDCAMWQGVQAPLHLQYQQQAQLLSLKKEGAGVGCFLLLQNRHQGWISLATPFETPKRFKAGRVLFFLLWWHASEWLHQRYQTWFPLGGSLIISTPLLATTGFFGKSEVGLGSSMMPDNLKPAERNWKIMTLHTAMRWMNGTSVWYLVFWDVEEAKRRSFGTTATCWFGTGLQAKCPETGDS